MIHALLQRALQRGHASKPGYTKKTVKWVLDFEASGMEFTGLMTSDKEFPAAPDLSFPELLALRARRGEAAHFLVAPLATFSASVKAEDQWLADSKERARLKTLIWMLKQAGNTDARLGAVSRALCSRAYLRSLRAELVKARPTPKPSDLATIRLDGVFPADEEAWHGWWDTFRTTLAAIRSKNQMASFATGELVEPVDTHPKITKLTGAGLTQPHAPIVTFDKPAFESYGLRKARNAAMDEKTAKAYVAELDDVLEDSVIYVWRRPKAKAARQLTRDYAKIAGARLAYWYVGPASACEEVESASDPIAALLGSADKDTQPPEDLEQERILTESRLRKTIESIRSGSTAQPLGDVRFCVLCLSGAGGRVMVRDFLEGTILQLATDVEQWFQDLSLETYYGQPGYPPALERVVTAPLPEKNRDRDYLKWVAPAGAWRQAVLRAALTGTELPDTVFSLSLLAHNRTVIEGQLTDEKEGPAARNRSRLRLGLVKAYLLRKGFTMKPALDPEHPSAAYHCGRLLAVYDSLQREALGEVGAGVIQRYYGGALTNPSGVFGQLSRIAQTHLSKVGGALAYVYDTRIAEIHNGIRREGDNPASFPTALGLDDQALFALGFWHQIAATNKEIAEAAAAKKAREEGQKNNPAGKENKQP